MIEIPLTKEIKEIAQRVIWFEQPEQSLKDPVRFIAYAMRYAHYKDMKVLRKYISDSDFIYALDHIPPGIVDQRSWSYWNALFDRYPAPHIPVRNFERSIPDTK
jgi:hypothetical protein